MTVQQRRSGLVKFWNAVWLRSFVSLPISNGGGGQWRQSAGLCRYERMDY